MDNLSKFSDTLDSLMFERGLNITQLAKETGINAVTIGRYLHAVYTPALENLVKLANYFHCSTDFLLGREQATASASFSPCPPFKDQLVVLKEHFQCSWRQFYKTAHISSSRFYEWKNGRRTPTLDCVILLADGFGCTVDFIIGRAKS